MTVYQRIVVGTDGSKTASRAVHKAAVLAERLGSPLVVTTGYTRPDESEGGPASVRAERTDSLGANAYKTACAVATDGADLARAKVGNIDVSTTVREGDPADILIDVAAGNDPSLLVVGNKGMTSSARFLLGNVPNKISHHALSDVLVSRTDIPTSGEVPQRLLVATDGSQTASRALHRGLDVAAALGASVTVLFVGFGGRGERVLEDARLRAEKQDVAFAADLRGGDAAEQIVSAGNDHDVVIVGNKGMTGAGRFLLGSVPNKVSHHIDTDLLIVRTVV